MTGSKSPKFPSRSPITTPLVAAVGLGVCVFLPWLESIGGSSNAMNVALDSLWSDLVDLNTEGIWLGVVLLTVAVFGFVAALVKAVPASVCRVLGVIAVVLVGMFFRALVAADGFEFIEFGAFGAAGFSLFMLAPR